MRFTAVGRSSERSSRSRARAAIRHVGPMAQEFQRAFAFFVKSETGIGTVDADDVALTAIQGLHQMMQEKEARIAVLERRIESPQSELTQLRQTVEALLAKTGGNATVAVAR